ncbi:hypothetical protein L596_020288 [Steinernema carpocapsae]|uniref:Cell division control protein 73 C-terminal domain-containing protein n=1 Tax=Steinernema carpocapsae TaxID=34508 RepID=A0A4U5MT69_STECR|nr:hypothetical protein L596_020288 [Steinernema carpocapsae]
MADPLRLLREHTTGRRPLRELDCNGEVYYVFGDVAYPRDVKTSLSVYNRDGEFYSLQALLTLWEKRQQQHTVYVRDVTALSIQVVTRFDRKELIDYLEGHRNELPSNYSVYATAPPPTPLARLQTALGENSEPDRKKMKMDKDARGNRLVDRLLDENGGQAAEDSEVRSLSNELTVERIAELKNKVKKQKRHQIKTVDNIDGDFDGAEGTAIIDRVKGSKERVWRTRSTCLVAPNKNFSSILSVLQSLRVREETSAKQKNGGQSGPPSAQKRPAPTSTGYSRYEQEKYEEDETAGFQIDPSLTFHGTSFTNIRSSTAPNAKPIAAPSSSKPAPKVDESPANGKSTKRPSRTPIIIIPASTSSLVTMYNVRDILQDMKFVPTEQRKSQRRETEILLQRRKDNGITVPYRVVDNPMKLTNEEWDRVVAVFVQGQAWQFKGWRWNGNPTDIFSHVAAFHLKYDEQKLDANVAKWSVTVLSLSKTKRHLDRPTLNKFWKALDLHIVKHKPHLRY